MARLWWKMSPSTWDCALQRNAQAADRSDNVAAHHYILGHNTTRHLRLVAEQKRATTSPSISPSTWISPLEMTLPLIVRSSPIIDGTIYSHLGLGSWKHRSPAAR